MALAPRPKARCLQTGPKPLNLKETQDPEEPSKPSRYQRAQTRPSDHATLSAAGAMPSEAYQYDIVYEHFKRDEAFKRDWNVLGQERSSSEDSISQERATIRVLMDLKPHQKLYPTAYTPGFPTVPTASGKRNTKMEPEAIAGLPQGYSVALDVYILDDVRIMLKFQKRFRKDRVVDPEYAWLEKLIPEIDAQRRDAANREGHSGGILSSWLGGGDNGPPRHVAGLLDDDAMADYPEQNPQNPQPAEDQGIVAQFMNALGLKKAESTDGIMDGMRYHIGWAHDGTWLGEHIGVPHELTMCIRSRDRIVRGKADTRESFLFERQSDGTYRIMVRSSGRALRQDVESGSGTRISTRRVLDDASGSFAFERQKDGKYRIRVLGSGLCLHGDESDGKDHNHMNILTVRPDTNTDEMRWILEEERDGLVAEMRKDERPEDALRPRAGSMPLDGKVAGWSEAVKPYTDLYGGNAEHVKRHVALGKHQVYGECMLVNPFGDERGLPTREYGTWARTKPRSIQGSVEESPALEDTGEQPVLQEGVRERGLSLELLDR